MLSDILLMCGGLLLDVSRLVVDEKASERRRLTLWCGSENQGRIEGSKVIA